MNPEHFDYTLTVDDKEYKGNTSMLVIANGPNIGGSRIPLTDLSPQDGKLNSFIFEQQSFSILNDIFKKRDSMNWNEITEGINHIPGSHITLRTEPNMKVDIDGEINLETPITIDVLPKAINILTFRMMRNNNYIIIKGMYECFKLHTYLYFNYYLKTLLLHLSSHSLV